MTPRRRRGDGGLYQRGDGMWVGVVDLPAGTDGKRRRKPVYSRDYATAQRKLAALRRQVEDAGGDVPTASTRLSAWLDTWLTTIVKPHARPKTYAQYASDVRLHITPAIGQHRLDQIKPAHVRAMHAAIARTHSPTTVLRCHAVLSKALSDAVKDGLIHRNVAKIVDRPRTPEASGKALTADQAVTLLRHVAAQPYGSRWAAALLTGARQGELLGLQRHRVGDLLDISWQLQRLPWGHGCGGTCGKRAASCPARVIDVPHGYEHRLLEGCYALVRPKGAKRIVPVGPVLRAILDRHMAHTDPGPHDLVWSRGGHPIEARADSRAWHEALAGAGLPPLPLHSARHTAATLLLELGHGEVSQSILGHSSAVTTRGYQHVSTALAGQGMTALEGVLTGSGLDMDTAPAVSDS